MKTTNPLFQICREFVRGKGYGSAFPRIGVSLSVALVLLVLRSSAATQETSAQGTLAVENNNALKRTPSTAADLVLRKSFSQLGDAPPLFYMASNNACTVSSGTGDEGSQVVSADGKCWLALFPANGLDVRDFGARGDGKTDSSIAVQACLDAAEGRTCEIGADAKGFRLYVARSIRIPANTTFTCSTAWADTGDYGGRGRFNTQTAILTGGDPGIFSGGEGATFRNCLQFPSTLHFPVPGVNAPDWQGTGVTDGGGGSFSLIEDMIVGYDTCVRLGGSRPYVRRLYLDCTGVSHAAFYDIIGNSDAGFIDEVEIVPFATGNAGENGTTCAGASRPGTGFYFGGFVYAGRLVAENFLNANYEIKNGQLTAELINSDDASWGGSPPQYCLSTFSGVGVELHTGASVQVGTMVIQSARTGLLSLSGYTGLQNQIANLWFNSVVGDCIRFGTATELGGVLLIGNLSTNQAASGNGIPNCGAARKNGYPGYLLDWADGSSTGIVKIGSVVAAGINSLTVGSGLSQAPFFHISQGVPALGRNLTITSLATDLNAGANPYATDFLVVQAGNDMLGDVQPLGVECTGLGARGSCGYRLGSNIGRGGVLMTTAGGGEASHGEIIMHFPFSGANGHFCTFAYYDAEAKWSSPNALIQEGDGRRTQRAIWTNGVQLQDGMTYQVNYDCKYQ